MSVGATPLELELAVVRGREYVVRAVFRPPSRVSVGGNPRAVVSLPDAELPDFIELFSLDDTRSVLRFDSDMTLELEADGKVRGARQLIAERRATEGPDGWELPLTRGLRGVIRFGGLQFLVKVQAPRAATIWDATAEGGLLCGGCGSPLLWPLSGGGALTPCRKCGDLTRVQAAAILREAGATSLVPAVSSQPQFSASAEFAQTRRSVHPPGPAAPEASSGEDEIADTVSDADAPLGPPPASPAPAAAARPGKLAELPTYDGIQVKKAADLPTFDGIEVKKASDLPTFDAIAAPGRIGPAQIGPPATGGGLPAAPPSLRPAIDAAPSKGADLPTFDAISVLKDGAALSTRAAIAVMRGGSEAEPPVQRGGAEAPAIPNLAGEADGIPTPAVPFRTLKVPDGYEKVEAGEPPQHPTGRVAQSVKKQVAELLGADAAAHGVAPARAPSPAQIAPAAPPAAAAATVPGPAPAPPPAPAPAAAPVAPAPPRPSAIPPSFSPVESVPEAVPLDERSVARSPGASAEEDEDDFLMGRDDGGIRAAAGGWALYALGVAFGAIGMALLVYALSR